MPIINRKTNSKKATEIYDNDDEIIKNHSFFIFTFNKLFKGYFQCNHFSLNYALSVYKRIGFNMALILLFAVFAFLQV